MHGMTGTGLWWWCKLDTVWKWMAAQLNTMVVTRIRTRVTNPPHILPPSLPPNLLIQKLKTVSTPHTMDNCVADFRCVFHKTAAGTQVPNQAPILAQGWRVEVRCINSRWPMQCACMAQGWHLVVAHKVDSVCHTLVEQQIALLYAPGWAGEGYHGYSLGHGG